MTEKLRVSELCWFPLRNLTLPCFPIIERPKNLLLKNVSCVNTSLPEYHSLVKKFKFLPIVVSSPHYLDELALGIKKTAEELNKRICIIASSDFTHFGYNYGYTPFTQNIKENLRKLDLDAVEIIKKYLGRLHLSSRVRKFWEWYLRDETES